MPSSKKYILYVSATVLVDTVIIDANFTKVVFPSGTVYYTAHDSWNFKIYECLDEILAPLQYFSVLTIVSKYYFKSLLLVPWCSFQVFRGAYRSSFDLNYNEI